jgi:hypothetical protein
MTSIREELDVADRVELIVFAYRNGLIERPH